MTNHNKNIGDRLYGRKVNQHNKEIVNWIKNLPIGAHSIYVEPDSLPMCKREGSMIFYSFGKWIHIVPEPPK